MAETLSDRLKNLIEQRGISQRNLAEKAETTEASISHYIKGDRTPSATTLAKLADALGTTPDYLLKGAPFSENERLDDAVKTIMDNARYLSYAQKLKLIESLIDEDR